MPSLTLVNGVVFDLMNPDPSKIDINHIAHSLGMLCRYNGHIEKFYSVAEHSVLVCLAIREKLPNLPTSVLLNALLHDAPEAYLGDSPAFIKKYIEVNIHNTTYKLEHIEDNILKVILQKYDIEFESENIYKSLVKEYDTRIRLDEVYALRQQSSAYKLIGPSLNVNIRGCTPEQAKDDFLSLFYELMNIYCNEKKKKS